MRYRQLMYVQYMSHRSRRRGTTVCGDGLRQSVTRDANGVV